MNYSKSGLDLTKGQERCKLTAYQDSGGVWTIAWGHTHGVKPGDTCTQLQAELWLLQDLRSSENCVQFAVFAPLTQGEFDALVDFVFNIGCAAFRASHMLIYLNSRNYKAAAGEFDKWDHVHGKVMQGLLRRRELETAEFWLS